MASEETSKAVQASASTTAYQQAPPEKPSHALRRMYIVLSYWAIVLLIGLPIWWKTTAIYRADLPLNDMLQWSEGKVSLT